MSMLKMSGNTLDSARDKSKLAGPLEVSGGDPRRLWLGPDRWLLVSGTMTPGVIIDSRLADAAERAWLR